MGVCYQPSLKTKNSNQGKNNFANKSVSKDKNVINNLQNQSSSKTKPEKNNLTNKPSSKDLKENVNLPSQSSTKNKQENNIFSSEFNSLIKNMINDLQNQSNSKDKNENNNSQIQTNPKNKQEKNNFGIRSDSKDKNEINNLQSQSSSKNQPENNNLKNKSSSKDLKEINNLSEQSHSKDKNYNNNFPRGTKYEEELNSNFKYYNVFWYDTNKTNDFELFKKCFENVQFYKGYDLYSTINFFKKESLSEWIVITSGSLGEELILNIGNFKCIKSFFIYCMNTKYHEKWANQIKKVGCLTSDPEILCQKFIEFNKNYIIPNFNYKSKENNDILLNLNKKSSEDLALINIPLKLIIDYKNRSKNKYNNLCIKIINYLNGDEIENDFKEALTNEGHLLCSLAKKITGMEELIFQSTKTNIENLTLLSLYFSKYPYLLNLLSFQEVKDLFNDEITSDLITSIQFKVIPILEKLSQKIKNNECILDEKDDLKEIQICCIYNLCFGLITANQDSKILSSFSQIMHFFRDVDFCLKLFLISFSFAFFNNKKNNFLDEINLCLTFCEPRYLFYTTYLDQPDKVSKFNEKEENLIYDSLTIKDFIIIGNNNFHVKIKTIEMNIKSKSFKYLNIEQISKYLEEKKNEKGVKIVPYYYFLIIKLEEYQENYEKIVLLSMKLGITFMAFVYIENQDKIKIPKNLINFLISAILVYSPEDIISYLSQKFKFNNPLDYPDLVDLSEFLNIKIPKISFEQSDEDKYQSGCFELAETFDVNLIKNKFVLRFFDDIDFITEFSKNIYNIYKVHNALDLFYSQNCIYFGWNLYPELLSFNICFIKRVLYMYCREEKEKHKSFYRIINNDLKSRDPYKIYQYINFLALINQMIEAKVLLSFKGKVYRATKLDENLILNLIPGAKMVNTTFWSTSKDFKVAENFMIKNNWRNTFIICNTSKNNIDIDLEKLNPYNEKEVLFTPFSEFRVEKISSEIKYKKKIYIIELTEIENRNFVHSDNMQVENVNNLGMKNQIENYWKSNGEQFTDQILNNFQLDLNEIN